MIFRLKLHTVSVLLVGILFTGIRAYAQEYPILTTLAKQADEVEQQQETAAKIKAYREVIKQLGQHHNAFIAQSKSLFQKTSELLAALIKKELERVGRQKKGALARGDQERVNYYSKKVAALGGILGEVDDITAQIFGNEVFADKDPLGDNSMIKKIEAEVAKIDREKLVSIQIRQYLAVMEQVVLADADYTQRANLLEDINKKLENAVAEEIKKVTAAKQDAEKYDNEKKVSYYTKREKVLQGVLEKADEIHQRLAEQAPASDDDDDKQDDNQQGGTRWSLSKKIAVGSAAGVVTIGGVLLAIKVFNKMNQ